MLNPAHRLYIPAGFLLAAALTTAAPALAQQTGAAEVGSGSSSSLPLNGQGGRSTPTAPPSTLTAVPEDFSDLKLTPGFLLDVQVYDDQQLSI